MDNLFEEATRKGVRYDSQVGKLTTEDLWKLPLTGRKPSDPDLDTVAKFIAQKIKQNEEESFVKQNRANNVDELKLEVVKHIIAYQLDVKAKLDEKIKNQSKKALILEALDKKQIEEISSKTKEELEAELKAL